MNSWQSKEQLTELLSSLAHYQSVTGTNAEIALAEYLHHLLAEKTYFQKNSDHLNLHPLDDGRHLLTALVKGASNTKETIILLSHFDVVGTEDYGSLENLAFRPKELTKEMNKIYDQLPLQVQKDLKQGEWLFGRGTMDMKAGLSIHLSMLERAMNGEFNGNILLLTVPDEEVNSKGMLTALPVLNQLKERENLEFNACLNGEPMFSKYPGDPSYYVYTGSIGKVLPGFYCYGKESHVGEPFSGINPNLMNSFLSQQLELNESFIEKAGDEVTPPPVSLMQRDLKEEYSVQTPQAAVSMYNVLYLQQSFNDINEKLLESAKKAAKNIETHVNEKAEKYADMASDFTMSYSKVHVMMYEELYNEAVKRFGQDEIDRIQNLLVNQREQGDRDFSTLLVQELAAMCKDLTPLIVLFYSPPFYPAVSSHQDKYISRVMDYVKEYVADKYGLSLTVSEFFTGLSDLSFIGPVSSKGKLDQLTVNMPLQNHGFTFPSDIMEKLTMPILNIGPLGKDAHQWTERLELSYSFEVLPEIVSEAIKQLLKK
ncbi:M20/M25/M40 family metallo-hydrolase [Virgibacillus halodenitrificans]|uniref:M20/M25/M40 family metallo-hydrolase n=1 Tax=Virgibacillus halodenitrificans TaxID=1482 RepID=A0ABR7VMZ7_VIRHA|nr:M20/M25/M40 family metallo-hydrolase [Virgibacillus halodenitrificans]MBD1222681.1 M20/M25/M40 family metallo-hydrolase [Virgibacillus halodenitrificans]MCG1029848.1 M20/M25/M40 family metallo-hydrolase [Virgibacillus halodenitrificans]MCJ0930936.1 M20/M25/M40 family metallo-hydrolase [Virgibacillus halodenitrificans]MEC2160900.1 M20/M25/M40 family metallo-hydrolase [Virgibacillus halodenitrificans]WHX28166.1 M20/M25/M40 family metallo-hydrolase [Virgibacillus halodenitrificans]